MKLLIVDDNINDCECLKELVDWETMGFTDISFAFNGQTGYEKAKEMNPTLIISDVSMPVMNGLEMAKSILRDLPNMKFIFISCFDDINYITEAIDRHAFGYLLKPINLDKLVETVKKVLKIENEEKEQEKTISVLKNKISAYMPAVREQMLRDIIFGASVTHKKMEDAGIKMEGTCAILALSIFADEDYLVTYAVKEKIQNFFENKYNVYALMHGKNKIAVLLDLKNKYDKTRAIDEVTYAMNDFCDTIECEYNLKLNVCIGDITGSGGDFKSAFAKCDMVLNVENGFFGIRLADEMTTQNAVINYDITELKADISNIVISGDVELLNEFVDKYYDDKTICTNYALNGFNFIVMALLQMALIDENENFGNIFGSDYSIWNKLIEYKSIVDIRHWIFNIFKGVIEYIKQKHSKDAPYISTVNCIKKYIDDNYAEIESISQIAKEVFLSDSYANHLFKQYEGITIFDYLTNVRMTAAKRLLKDKSVKIYEIANRVGYGSSAYFSNVFKACEGVTPKKYRENL